MLVAHTQQATMTDNTQCLACWLGVLHHVGSDLCYWLLTKYGKIVSNSSSIQHVTHDDYLQKDKRKEIKVFDQKLKDWLDDKNIVVPSDCLAGMFLEDIDDLVNDSGGIIHKEDHTPSDNDYGENFPPELPEANEEDVIDKYLNAELISNLRMYDEECGQVVKRARGPKGEPIGCAHNNPLFETCKYDVEYTNGLHE
jgi:hypothetical protein